MEKPSNKRNLEIRLLLKSATTGGQMLVETMIALTVLVVGLLGIVTLLTRSIALNTFVSQEYTGTYLAAEGIELVKNLIDHNVQSSAPWNKDLSDGEYEMEYTITDPAAKTPFFAPGNPLILGGAGGFYSYLCLGASCVPSGFRRKISIQSFGSERMNVKSLVWWNGPFGTQSSELEDEFYSP